MTVTRTAALLPLLLLAATACGADKPAATSTPKASASASPSASASAGASPSPSAPPTPKVVNGAIAATDESFRLRVPAGWQSATRGVPAPFVLAVQNRAQGADQLVASSFPNPGDAAETALATIGGLRKQKVACTSVRLGGLEAVDCSYTYQSKVVRKLFFPLRHGTGSTLVLYQTFAPTRAAGYAKVRPILATWRWQDGSKLGAGR